MLREYEAFKPGFATEVVDWIKDQTRHRQSLEKQTTDGSEARLGSAQRNALAIALLTLIVGAIVSQWNTWFAVAAILLGIGGPSGATIVARILDRLGGGGGGGPPAAPPPVATAT